MQILNRLLLVHQGTKLPSQVRHNAYISHTYQETGILLFLGQNGSLFGWRVSLLSDTFSTLLEKKQAIQGMKG